MTNPDFNAASTDETESRPEIKDELLAEAIVGSMHQGVKIL